MRFAVVQFGGSNCDLDTQYVCQEICGVDTDMIWYKDGMKNDYDAIIIPGGFSYGDYLRSGAIAAKTEIMRDIKSHASAGGLVLGICNGAQIGCESGLIDGIFTRNMYPKFISKPVFLRVENNVSPFTSEYRKGEIIRIPIAHKDGRYEAPPDIISKLNGNNQVAFRFCDQEGKISEESNPNGSLENITGVLNREMNVMVMMPHPERASEKVLGSEDGLRIFKSMISYCDKKEK